MDRPLEADQAPGPDDQVVTLDLTERARRAMSSLPPEQRAALELAYLGGKTSAEISDLEGIPVGTAKTRIRAALLRLRESMAPENVDELEAEIDPRSREGPTVTTCDDVRPASSPTSSWAPSRVPTTTTSVGTCADAEGADASWTRSAKGWGCSPRRCERTAPPELHDRVMNVLSEEWTDAIGSSASRGRVRRELARSWRRLRSRSRSSRRPSG